jgi:hypothetical protein
MPYSPVITAKKSAARGLAIAVVYAAMEYATVADIDLENPRPLIAGLAAAIITGAINWWKNQGKALFDELTKGDGK